MQQRTVTPPAVLVLGLGNVLWADDGFGVRAVETLQRRYRFPDHVTVMDGGTQGFCLLRHVQAADILVVFDAVDCGLAPGSLKQIEGDEVPKLLGARKTSLHQAGFDEVLALAGMLGDHPGHLLLIGVQPVELEDFGGGLRPAVQRQIEPAIGLALDYLEGRGVTPLRHLAAG
jgi:hydrogenase maturation protease